MQSNMIVPIKTSNTILIAIACLFSHVTNVVAQMEVPETHLCVFVPVTSGSKKDMELLPTISQTWGREDLRRAADAEVFIVSVDPNITNTLPVLVIPNDIEVIYDKLPLRTFIMWSFLGSDNEFKRKCKWYMKADADTYVNLKAVADRISCFPYWYPQYLGVVHSVHTLEEEDSWLKPVWFGHGGSGYMVSHALVEDAGVLSQMCYDYHKGATGGRGMEDVLFALCLLQKDVQVHAYGLQAEEYVLDFHLTGDIWLRTDALNPCYLVLHPVERVDRMKAVHNVVNGDSDGSCLFNSYKLAEVSSKRTKGPANNRNGQMKNFFERWQVGYLHQCAQRRHPDANSPERCRWSTPITKPCQGMNKLSGPENAKACEKSCCDDSRCAKFQFDVESRQCWLSDFAWCAVMDQNDSRVFQGAVKKGVQWQVQNLGFSDEARIASAAEQCGSFLTAHSYVREFNRSDTREVCRQQCGKNCRCAVGTEGYCLTYGWPEERGGVKSCLGRNSTEDQKWLFEQSVTLGDVSIKLY